MNDIDSAMSRLLKAHSVFLGTATMPGRLYDLGRYPGAIFDAQSDALVIGHVFQIKDAAAVFPTLDRYEDIDPQQPTAGEYRRELVLVQLGETQRECWVYLYNLPTESLREIPGGDYLTYLKGNADYQNFIRSV